MTASVRIAAALNSPANPAGNLRAARLSEGTPGFHALLQKQSGDDQESSAPAASKSQPRTRAGVNAKAQQTSDRPAKAASGNPEQAAQDPAAAAAVPADSQTAVPPTQDNTAGTADPVNPADANQGDSVSFTYAVETLLAADAQDSPASGAPRTAQTVSKPHTASGLSLAASGNGQPTSAAGDATQSEDAAGEAVNPAALAAPLTGGQQAAADASLAWNATSPRPPSGFAQDSGASNEPRIDADISSNAASNAPVAFEARLVSSQNPQASPTDSQPAAAVDPSALKPASALPAASEDSACPAPAVAPKVETLFQASPVTEASATPASASKEISAPASPTAAERMQQLIEAPAPPASAHSAIVVKVPGETGEAPIDLRFSERGGEIHLSVRTANPATAQELRGNLNDFVGSMAHAGIRAEVSSPAGASSQSSSGSSDGQSADQRDSGRQGSGRQQQDGGSNEHNSRGSSSRWKWMEALQQSNDFSKEQNL